MADTVATDPSIASLQNDIAALKRDMASLIDHLKTTASNSASEAAGRIDEGAREIYRTVSTEGCRAARMMEKSIEDQPLVALCVALGIGYIGGRLLTR